MNRAAPDPQGRPCCKSTLSRLLALFLLPLITAVQASPTEWQYQLDATGSADLHSSLAAALAYKFTLPRDQLLRATVYVGPNHRLRRVMHSLLQPHNLKTASQRAAWISSLAGTHSSSNHQSLLNSSNSSSSSSSNGSLADNGPMLKVGVVGGSISWGQGASKVGINDWFNLVIGWLRGSFPGVTISGRNGCVPATPASLMTMCLEHHMDPDVDLMFIEYALNDGLEDSLLHNQRVKVYERLVRRIMGAAHAPAVVLVQVHSHGMFTPVPLSPEDNSSSSSSVTSTRNLRQVLSSSAAPGIHARSTSTSEAAAAEVAARKQLPVQRHRKHLNRVHRRLRTHQQRLPVVQIPFHQTPAELYGAVAQYYDAPWLSFRNAIYRLGEGPLGRDYTTYLQSDYLHPNDLGHKAMADMVVWLMLQTALGLGEWPLQEQRVQEAAMLPTRSMYPGNYPAGFRTCYLEQAFPQLVESAQGWVFGNDGSLQKPKWGFIANTPGAVMKVKLDLQAVPNTGTPDSAMIIITYLKSYQHMGVAAVSCVAGCTCTEQEVNGWHEAHESVIRMAHLEVTPPNGTCTLQIQLTSKTNTGEHKFRVAGVIVNEHVNSITGSDLGTGRWLPE